ncbi:MAG: class I SAM-dependent methyltransferase [Thioalkalivibrionaceae bacterium]
MPRTPHENPLSATSSARRQQSADPDGIACPLCRSQSIRLFATTWEPSPRDQVTKRSDRQKSADNTSTTQQKQRRDYLRCTVCELTFLHPKSRLCAEEEAAHYRTHNNQVDDPRYRAFLARLAGPLIARLRTQSDKPSTGLDFGCGPGPALADMLSAAGHHMSLFDPFFYPDPWTLERTYDFITCTEVAEHLHNPGPTLERLLKCLKPQGLLAAMTTLQQSDHGFARWPYRRDPTHVVFYRMRTFQHFARLHELDFSNPAPNVIFLARR